MIRLLPIRSARARLTLWNVGVLALVLLAFGMVLRVSMRSSLIASIDRDIEGRARFHQAYWQFAPTGGPEPWETPRMPAAAPPGTRAGGGQRQAQGVPAGATPAARPQGARAPRLPGGPPPGSRGRPGAPPAGLAPPRGQGDGERRGEWQPRPIDHIFDVQGRRLWPPGAGPPWDQAAFLQAAKGRQLFSVIEMNDQRVRILSAPLRRYGQIRGVIQVAYSLADVERATGNLDRTLLALIPLAMAAAGLGGMFLTGRMIRPVRDVTQAASRIGAEDLSRRLSVSGQDEFAVLSATFNDMLGRLQRSFEQQRRFTADASHELRTPLTVIKANTSLALSRGDLSAEHRRAMSRIDQAAGLMGRLVQDLLLLARSDAGQLELALRPTCLADVLRAAVDCSILPEGPAVHSEVTDPALQVEGDATYLTRLFANLLENAARHTPADGSVTISARPDGDAVVVAVRDTGCGIAPEHLAHLCERFYRVDDARARAHGGTGLGLAICQSIGKAHGGALAFESTVGEGTTVRVTLRRAAPTAEG